VPFVFEPQIFYGSHRRRVWQVQNGFWLLRIDSVSGINRSTDRDLDSAPAEPIFELFQLLGISEQKFNVDVRYLPFFWGYPFAIDNANRVIASKGAFFWINRHHRKRHIRFRIRLQPAKRQMIAPRTPNLTRHACQPTELVKSIFCYILATEPQMSDDRPKNLE
jgi:hypothetical protein